MVGSILPRKGTKQAIVEIEKTKYYKKAVSSMS